jgi:hypothetical protein
MSADPGDTPSPSGPAYDANVLRGTLHAHIEAGHGLLESAMEALSRLEGRALSAGELPAGADEDALNSVERLRSKMMSLGNRDGTSALYHLAIIERALRARFDADADHEAERYRMGGDWS